MHLVVLTPDKELFDGEVTRVKVPGSKGQFEILENHAPIVSSLDPGTITIVNENGEEWTVAIDKGFVEVLDNNVNLLVQGAEENA